MITEEHVTQQPEDRETRQLWCYLVSLRGELYAVPDEPGAVLMPHINRLPAVTPLPLGLVRPYVLGLVNVGLRGEVLIDLAAFLGLPDTPAPAEQHCLLVIGESAVDASHAAVRRDPYRLAFAVDAGYELAQLDGRSRGGHEDAQPPVPEQRLPAGPALVREQRTNSRPAIFVRDLIETRRGRATLLDMEAICTAIVAELGAERPWNAPAHVISE